VRRKSRNISCDICRTNMITQIETNLSKNGQTNTIAQLQTNPSKPDQTNPQQPGRLVAWGVWRQSRNLSCNICSTNMITQIQTNMITQIQTNLIAQLQTNPSKNGQTNPRQAGGRLVARGVRGQSWNISCNKCRTNLITQNQRNQKPIKDKL